MLGPGAPSGSLEGARLSPEALGDSLVPKQHCSFTPTTDENFIAVFFEHYPTFSSIRLIWRET